MLGKAELGHEIPLARLGQEIIKKLSNMWLNYNSKKCYHLLPVIFSKEQLKF